MIFHMTFIHHPPVAFCSGLTWLQSVQVLVLQVIMDLRVWPLLVLVLVLLMPTCGGEVQVKKAAGVGPAVAKVAANLKRGAEEKVSSSPRSSCNMSWATAKTTLLLISLNPKRNSRSA